MSARPNDFCSERPLPGRSNSWHIRVPGTNLTPHFRFEYPATKSTTSTRKRSRAFKSSTSYILSKFHCALVKPSSGYKWKLGAERQLSCSAADKRLTFDSPRGDSPRASAYTSSTNPFADLHIGSDIKSARIRAAPFLTAQLLLLLLLLLLLSKDDVQLI